MFLYPCYFVDCLLGHHHWPWPSRFLDLARDSLGSAAVVVRQDEIRPQLDLGFALTRPLEIAVVPETKSN